MSAKEMFEELGYELTYENGEVKKYKRKIKMDNDYINIKYIEFSLNNIQVEEILFDDEGTVINDMIVSTIFKDELKAINQQCNELGWIE